MQHPDSKLEVNEPPRPLRNNPFVRPRGDARPIHNLPFELLARAFGFGTGFEFGDEYLSETWYHDVVFAYNYQLLEEAAGEEKAPAEDGKTRYDRLPFQIIISHVCRHWRDIAISTPTLWTDIKVHLDRLAPHELVSLHLERNQDLPIGIAVDSDSDCPDHRQTAFSDAQRLYALLVPHISRRRSLDIEAGDSLHMFAFLDAISNSSIAPASQLTTVRLKQLSPRVVQMRYPQVRTQFFNLFNGSAPRLTHLVLLGVSAPALRKLTLDGIARREPPGAWFVEPTGTNGLSGNLNASIPLLQLTELVLSALRENVGIGLLQKLYMPALKTLFLDLSEDRDYSNFVGELAATAILLTPPSAEDPAPSLLSRLERLAILSLRCQDRDKMVTLFDNLGNLKCLRVPLVHNPYSYPCQTLLLDLLLPVKLPNDGGRRLPQLESLFVWPSMSNGTHLRDIVQQRMDAGVPLKALYTSGEELNDMENEGKVWFCERLALGSVDEVELLDVGEAFIGPVVKIENLK